MRLVLLILLFAVGQPALAEPQRHALVIGNAEYKNEQPLVNTLNDARDIATKLKSLNFTVTRVENTGRRQLARSVNRFLRQVQGRDGVALFYYSGHGMQVGGQNYLVPVDALIKDELDVRSEGLPLDQVLSGLGGRGSNAVNLIILDACRNNPFKKDGTRAIGGKGLARMEAPESTLILYATKPGATASDNPGGRNGLFTKYLLKAMAQPGVKVEEAFRSVATNVYRDSRGAQYPWPEGLTFRPFYFVPPPPPGMRPVPPPPPAADPELMFWSSVSGCGTAACYRSYLESYPNGRFAALAKAQLKRLEDAQPPPPETIPFTVKTTPEGANVRILNIAPKYYDGIELKPGRYQVEVSRSGYSRHTEWYRVDADHPVIHVELAEKPKPMAPARPPVAAASPRQPTEIRHGGSQQSSGNRAFEKALARYRSGSTGRMGVKAPDIAENGAVVPVTFNPRLGRGQKAWLTTDGGCRYAELVNPSRYPLVSYSTRVKMAGRDQLIALAMNESGAIDTGSQLVKITIGGMPGSGACAGRYATDFSNTEALFRRLDGQLRRASGSTKLRAHQKSGNTVAKMLFSHPMETGARKDRHSGRLIPAHYIEAVGVYLNGRPVAYTRWGPAISKNPYLSVAFEGGSRGDEIRVVWFDNQGKSGGASTKVK